MIVTDDLEDAANKAQLIQNILAITALILSIVGFFIYFYDYKLVYFEKLRY
jgi:hypothetical protein